MTAPDWRGRSIDRRYRLDERPGLTPTQTVIGVVAGGAARAYPLTVRWEREVVTDSLGGTPILVTYCPLCRSGMVAERTLDSATTEFWASGLLWQPPRIGGANATATGRVFSAGRRGETDERVRRNRNLALVDGATRSYWSQFLARGICGPREGADLSPVPSTVTTWEAWRSREEATDVLLLPPYSGTTAGPPY